MSAAETLGALTPEERHEGWTALWIAELDADPAGPSTVRRTVRVRVRRKPGSRHERLAACEVRSLPRTATDASDDGAAVRALLTAVCREFGWALTDLKALP